MYLKKMHVKNFRCISTIDLELKPGLNVIIGPNNCGKTALLDSLRLALGFGGYNRNIYISTEDFFVDKFGNKAHMIEIDLIFSGLAPEDKGVFIEMLKVNSNGNHELELHIRYKLESKNGIERIRVRSWGGEKEENTIPLEIMELFYVVHLEALRDSENYLKPNRGNRLGQLFLKLVPEKNARETHAQEVHKSIASNKDWNKLIIDAQEKINEHLKNTTLKNNILSIDIDFAPMDFTKIAERLKIYIPMLRKMKRETIEDISKEEGWEKYFENPFSNELFFKKDITKLLENEKNVNLKDKISRLEHSQKFEIYQNGLGYNNLIYIATIIGDLIERINRKSESYIALLIEEPEAHLHPQLQNILFNYFKNIETRRDIQIFLTSHSPTITAKTEIDTVFLMSNSSNVDVLPLGNIEFKDEKKRNYLKRFLDVTKSQLFFADGVIFVEGISEALLLQIFSEILDIDLEKYGIEIVNIGGVAFKPFVELFNSTSPDKRMKIRGAILSDDDRSNGKISDRAESLKGEECDNLKVYLAERTFEYELFIRNEELLTEIHITRHPNTPFQGTTTEEKAEYLLERLKSNKDKGEFSQLLAEKLINDETLKKRFVVPPYIQNCINWVVGFEN